MWASLWLRFNWINVQFALSSAHKAQLSRLLSCWSGEGQTHLSLSLAETQPPKSSSCRPQRLPLCNCSLSLCIRCEGTKQRLKDWMNELSIIHIHSRLIHSIDCNKSANCVGDQTDAGALRRLSGGNNSNSNSNCWLHCSFVQQKICANISQRKTWRRRWAYWAGVGAVCR